MSCCFQNLWIERTTYTTSHVLPGILQWFEVVDYQTEALSPIRAACDTMQQKNIELRQQISDISVVAKSGGKLLNITDFSRTLGGVINAAVNGGIRNYQEVPHFSCQ